MEWKAINKEGRHVGLDFYDLLIEGRYTQSPCSRHFEENGEVTTTVHAACYASARMTPEQEELLNRRFREAIVQQPELERLKEVLLHVGGEFLVAPPKPDQDVPMLLERGFLMSGPIMLNVMESSSCHQNVASVWARKEFGIVGIATGYALSDGLWRQHSWGVLRDGVLETTRERLKYFGILFQGKRADFFAESNSG